MLAAEQIPNAVIYSRKWQAITSSVLRLQLRRGSSYQPQPPSFSYHHQQREAGVQLNSSRQHHRHRHRPGAGNSFGEIGDDLREIKDDLIERFKKNGKPSAENGAPGVPEAPPPNASKRSPWTDWSHAGTDEDWDDWRGSSVPDLDDEEDIAELREQVIERRRRRQGKRSRVRDEYLRPIVDVQGIYNRLTYDEREAEERVFVEAITNQYESKEALKYAGTLVAVPLTIGFLISRLVAEPLWSYAERINPHVFDVNDEQKVEGAQELKLEELRIRMEASIGRAPPLTDAAIVIHLSHEAKHIAEEFREYNKRSMLNVVSDSTSATVFFILLLQNTAKRQILFRTLGRVFTGLSDTAKAFIIILFTDILLGYHSEEGWTAVLKLASRHYGAEPEVENIYIFVSTVPVFLDTCFKYWIFVGLNKEDPAAAVTLKQMDRH